MKKGKKHYVSKWIGRHIIALSVVIATVSGVMGFLAWHVYATNQKVLETDAATSAFVAESDKKLKEIEARKAAEEKARQEAAAKEAAEQARTSDGSTATTIDSKACNSSKTHNNPANSDVVVNKKHCMQPLNYSPADLVTSNGATLSEKAITAFNQMFAAAAAAGQPFSVTSSFRSYTTQVTTYSHWVSISGQAGADTYSARPGYSEHQTGFAFDVAAGSCTLDCFGSTTQYTWFQQNAANYGFIQRYYAGYEAITGYKAEEWHYRYVGVDVAKDMQAKGVKTLEQYWNISGGDY